MQSLKNINRNIKIKNYYFKEIYNGKSYIGNIIDKTLFRLTFCAIMFMYIYIKTQSIIASFNISVGITAIYSLLVYKINKKKLNKNIEIINGDILKDKIYKNLVEQSKEEYVTYIKDLLKEINFKNSDFTIDQDIDIIFEKTKNKSLVRCFQYTDEHKVDINDFGKVLVKAREKGIDRVMLITTSSYAEDIKKSVANFNANIGVDLIDMDGIIKILKNSSIYPNKNKIENIIVQKLNDDRMRLIKESKKNIFGNSSRRYIISGIVLLLFEKFTPYSSYYKLVSYILISLGSILFIKTKLDLVLPKEGIRKQ